MNKTTETDAFKRLKAVMKDVDGDHRQIIKSLQDQVEYLLEKCKILEKIAVEKNNGKAIVYSDEQKKRLTVKGKRLNEFLLGTIEMTFAPGTVFGWYSELIGKKYNSVGPGQKRRGHPPILPEVVSLVLNLAENNPEWGYDRIAGVVVYLGYAITASTIRKILNDHGIIPDPEQRRRGDWIRFMDTQQAVTAATDYAQTEIVTPAGLVRYSSLFFEDCGSREVRLGGLTHDPDSQWTTQIARNMCDMWDGWLLGKKYLIHYRDVTFTIHFDNIFKSIGITIKKLPPYTPMMNSRMENFIRALKLECLDKMIFRSPEELHYAITQYLEYWNHYRPHAGLGGKMVLPYDQDPNGEIHEISFLGGLLHGYRKVPVAA